jgi:hypothetical protein
MLFLPLGVQARGHAGPAPADEYFGPYKESILGIRNHLNDLERKRDPELNGSVRGIDNEEIAIEDWQAKYPQDPWLPHYLNRCVHLYARSHSLSHGNATHALALLHSDYARTADARDAFATAGPHTPQHTAKAPARTTHRTVAQAHTTMKKRHCILGIFGRCRSN